MIMNELGLYELMGAMFTQAVKDYKKGTKEEKDTIAYEIEKCTLLQVATGLSGADLRGALIERSK